MSGNAILFLPGMNPNPSHTDLLRELFTKAGYTFLPYQGWSNVHELGRKSLREIHQEIEILLEPYEHAGVLGKSFGGGLALTLSNPRVQCLALWAPAFRLADQSNLDEWMDRKLSELDRVSSIALGPLDAAKVQAPVLVMHGTNDTTVPLENSQQLAQALPKGHLSLIEGAGHSSHVEEVARLAIEFFNRRLS